MSFTKNMGKNLSSNYGQKLLDIAKKSTIDVTKTASKRAIQQTAEPTGDLIGNKIVSKKSSTHLQNNKANDESEAAKEDTCLQKKDNKLLMN